MFTLRCHRIHRVGAIAALSVACLATGADAQDPNDRYQNLQVLPRDITQRELNQVMLANLRGLGLPRLLGRGCLYCHVGDIEQPRADWDYASDDKPAKLTARAMMTMVREINEQHLSRLEDRVAPDLRVSCYTCHAGRTDPRPLPAVLWAAYEAGGVDSAETRYRQLRSRYFGGDAYDFRVDVLAGVAYRMAGIEAYDDAIATAALNVDVNPNEPFAKRTWVQLGLLRTINTIGVPAALAELDRLEPDLEEGVFTPRLLDDIAWPIMRQDRQAEAVALIRRNFETFPEEYVANESMAFALSATGERDAAIQILEQWLQRDPDHTRARQTLTNMQRRR